MADGGLVRPDQVSLGVLVAAVSRDVIDDAVAVRGVGPKRSDGKLPAHVIAYLTLCRHRQNIDYVDVPVMPTLSSNVLRQNRKRLETST